MEITLLENGRGVILTRNPEKIMGDMWVSFKNSPKAPTTAIFVNENGRELYKLIENGSCTLPNKLLEGKVSLTVISNENKWQCESIYCEKMDDNILVVPNDMDLPQRVVELESLVSEYKSEINDVRADFDRMKVALERLMKGYDIFSNQK